MLVHVVSFSPASDDLASTGGFEWRYSLADARQEMFDHLHTENIEWYTAHNLALVHLEIPAEHAGSSDAITDYIDSHLELIEPRGTPVAAD